MLKNTLNYTYRRKEMVHNSSKVMVGVCVSVGTGDAGRAGTLVTGREPRPSESRARLLNPTLPGAHLRSPAAPQIVTSKLAPWPF